ncbi:MAG TPA: 1-acyl-sn-glycerol-3-phosphate acyltransferase [Polyangiales bacterium]|nr:1-acyl-sn-glycerol-3-phosphate acyltransferase [Polyangiales bacterium]
MRLQDAERAKHLAAERVVDAWLGPHRAATDHQLEVLINDTLYHEQRRLERESKRDPVMHADKSFYRGVRRALAHASSSELQALLGRMAARFADEIAGHFDERVYKLATTLIPAGLSVLLRAASPRQLTSLTSLSSLRTALSEHMEIQGPVDHVRALLERGTLVVVPTHSSHLDSIALGYGVHLLGMPPLLYGAGLNLFKNPLISFFMQNLGAYRVDRKKSAGLYKDVLKEYATATLELGYNNLFFPGGTRSRNGAVEQKLKKGLLGTAMSAYVRNLRANKPRPNIYFVPCTISYKLVLEAETLIDDYLKEVGKSRYIIEDDEFSQPRRILNFLTNLISLDSRVVITFSEPLDIVGNRVDQAGHSIDPRGRPVDPVSYVTRGGVPVDDPQRDAQYTGEVANAVAGAFLRDNVVMSTHVVAYALLELLRRRNPDLDLYRLLRTGGTQPSVQLSELGPEVERTVAGLKRSSTPPRLGRELQQPDARAIIDDALRHFQSYHTEPAALRRGERVIHRDRNLLYYYGNRLAHYGLNGRDEAPHG